MITPFEDLFLDEQAGEDFAGSRRELKKKKKSVAFLVGPYLQDQVSFTLGYYCEPQSHSHQSVSLPAWNMVYCYWGRRVQLFS